MATDPRYRRLVGLSVRTRITVAVAVLVGLALAGAGVVVYALETAAIERSISKQVEQELAELATLERSGDPHTGQPYSGAAHLVREFLARNIPNDDEILVGYWQGAPQVASGAASTERFPAYRPFRAAVTARETTGGTARLDTARWGEVVVSVQPVTGPGSSGAFVVASFLGEKQRSRDRIVWTYAVIAVLSLGLITAVAAAQAGRLLRPLRALRENAEEITETDLSRRIPETGNDDITALTRTFNQMLGRLGDAFEGQRRFLDDVGHELKTPLTVVRGHLELVEVADPVDVKTTRDLLLDEIDRMSRLVDDLIVLAKADRPDFVQPGPVAIAALTENVLDKCRALGDRQWRLDVVADVVAEVDRQRITQAMLELAHNAVKHTQPGDVVAVGSSADLASGLRMWVRDTGPGVREEDERVMFQRFGRGAVRESDEGFGLGLSIVRAIAEAHGGTACVEDVVPHGAKFVLTLPMSRAVRRGGTSWRVS